jgi:hypothetical protein
MTLGVPRPVINWSGRSGWSRHGPLTDKASNISIYEISYHNAKHLRGGNERTMQTAIGTDESLKVVLSPTMAARNSFEQQNPFTKGCCPRAASVGNCHSEPRE